MRVAAVQAEDRSVLERACVAGAELSAVDRAWVPEAVSAE